MIHKSLKSKLIDRKENFLLIELELGQSDILIGAIYVPPKNLTPIEIFDVFKGKEFFLFGDFNAKHTSWSCESNNNSGVELNKWLEDSGYEGIFPSVATSRRSNAIIDFAIGQSASGWTTEVVDIGTSDHYPILFSSPFSTEKQLIFRKTNWTIFTFFLTCSYQYWNAFVYNIDAQEFFTLFSKFLKALWDRVSTYEMVQKYRPPWPEHLVVLAKQVNNMRRKYRKTQCLVYLYQYKKLRSQYRYTKRTIENEIRDRYIENLTDKQNIWKVVKPTFRPFLPSFRGLKTKDNGIVRDNNIVVEQLAEYFEKHFALPTHDAENKKTYRISKILRICSQSTKNGD